MADTVPAPTQAAVNADLKAAYTAELEVVKARVAVLEAAGHTGWADVVAWFKASWLHVAIAVGVGALVMKAFGLHISP